jgi:hypothetical protein
LEWDPCERDKVAPKTDDPKYVIVRYRLIFNLLGTPVADGMRIAKDCAKGKFLYTNG